MQKFGIYGARLAYVWSRVSWPPTENILALFLFSTSALRKIPGSLASLFIQLIKFVSVKVVHNGFINTFHRKQPPAVAMIDKTAEF